MAPDVCPPKGIGTGVAACRRLQWEMEVRRRMQSPQDVPTAAQRLGATFEETFEGTRWLLSSGRTMPCRLMMHLPFSQHKPHRLFLGRIQGACARRHTQKG